MNLIVQDLPQLGKHFGLFIHMQTMKNNIKCAHKLTVGVYRSIRRDA